MTKTSHWGRVQNTRSGVVCGCFYQQVMRLQSLLITATMVTSCFAQEADISPTEELKTTVSQWVETMRQIQEEENEWTRDEEVLGNYREGLKAEIDTLNKRIKEAKTRNEGIDVKTKEKEAQRDKFVEAKEALTEDVNRLEDELLTKLPLYPAPLVKDPKVAQWIDALKATAAYEGDQRTKDISKRLMNILNLVAEAEKFQTTVHVRDELHTDSKGTEHQLSVVYFGLSCAYGVSKDGKFAVQARPGADGWKFIENNDLAPDIQSLVATILGEQDAAFIQLSLPKP